MDNPADTLTDLLFGSDRKLLNFKMTRGDRIETSEEELREAAHGALQQARLGLCPSAARFEENKHKTFDVEALHAQLTD